MIWLVAAQVCPIWLFNRRGPGLNQALARLRWSGLVWSGHWSAAFLTCHSVTSTGDLQLMSSLEVSVTAAQSAEWDRVAVTGRGCVTRAGPWICHTDICFQIYKAKMAIRDIVFQQSDPTQHCNRTKFGAKHQTRLECYSTAQTPTGRANLWQGQFIYAIDRSSW